MYSFDVFDTLITRRTADPKGIFMLMQKIMQTTRSYNRYLTENFYELRIGSEELARYYKRIKGEYEVTFNDIYQVLANTACISNEQQEELKEIEIKIEYKNVLGISKNVDFLKQLYAQGEHIVLISDMYLKEEHIRDMLCRIDSVFKDIPLYVSSEYGQTKGNQGLFRIVQKMENVDFSNWTHYGDNQYADIESAKKLGIKAVHLIPESIKEYERPQKNLYHQLSIGVSRYLRDSGKNSIACEVGSSLAGPILYPYVSWVLKESLNQGVNRLYFVARDGWILWQIADVIIKERQYPIKISYIYGSRTAWRLPCFDGSRDDFEKILQYSNMEEIICLNDLAKLFQIQIKELRRFLPEKLESITDNQKISRYQVDTIGKWLQENEKFRKYLVKCQEKNRDLVIRYLQQEIDVSDDNFAFIELSGTGYTQKCLARLIRNYYQGDIKNYFYRLDDFQEEEQCKFIQFYPSNLKRYILELLCRAPHGQTECYREENGKILPVLEQTEGEQIKAYRIEEYRDAVLDYVEQMEKTYIQNGLECTENLGIAREYIELISSNPPKRIAEYFCHMPFASDGRKNSMVEFAPPVTRKQLRKIYFWNNGENARQVYHGDYIAYALAISKEAIEYKEKCQKYRKYGLGKFLVEWNRYFRTGQKPGIDFFCPWELLKGNIVIYGAGKVGQAYVMQARQRCAKCSELLWIDSNYAALQKDGMEVHSPEEIMNYSFDRIIIAVHNFRARQEIWDRLYQMGIEAEKIYYG